MTERFYFDNRGLIFYWLRYYRYLLEGRATVDADDLVQAGALALLEAENTFNPEQGSFSTWASYYIRAAMLDALGLRRRRTKNAQRVFPVFVPLDAPAYDDDSDTTIQETIPDTSLPDMDEGILSGEIVHEVRSALEQLPEKLRSVTQLHDLDGLTYAACDQRLELMPGEAKAANARAFRLLRRNRRLRALAALDEETRFYAHKGVKAFYSSGSSVVEDAVMWRLSQGLH